MAQILIRRQLPICHRPGQVQPHSPASELLLLLTLMAAIHGCKDSQPHVNSGWVAPISYPLPTNAEIRRNPVNDTIRFLRADGLASALESDEKYRRSRLEGRYAAMAIAFVEAHRSEFRLQDPAAELSEKRVSTDSLGLTHVRLAQAYRGVPIFAAELLVHFRSPDGVYLVNGSYVPTPTELETTPTLTTDGAFEIVAAQLPALGGSCKGCEADLVIVQLHAAEPKLAHRVRVRVSFVEGWDYFIDAHSGAVLHRISTVHTGTGKPTS